MTAVGFAGLGAMGSRLAGRLLEKVTKCTAPSASATNRVWLRPCDDANADNRGAPARPAA